MEGKHFKLTQDIRQPLHRILKTQKRASSAASGRAKNDGIIVFEARRECCEWN